LIFFPHPHFVFPFYTKKKCKFQPTKLIIHLFLSLSLSLNNRHAGRGSRKAGRQGEEDANLRKQKSEMRKSKKAK
jgi:hypothetical protein